ncbi:MAG: hypothetical protein VYA54_08075 [Bdellovibrionota bacterium]|nr:hypothetical protein [Bdellovibrionota bacterium]
MKRLAPTLTLILCLTGCRPDQADSDWTQMAAVEGQVHSEEESDANQDDDNQSDKISKTIERNYSSLKKTICEPLGSDAPSLGESNGLKGDLRLIKELEDLPADSNRRNIQSNLNNYLDPTYSYGLDDTKLFLSNVDIPERSFLEGFSTQEGQVLQVNNEPLFEFFNVNLESIIKIEDQSLAGEYEFAILSDDGSKLHLKPSGAEDYITYIDSSREHAPKFLCGKPQNSESPHVSIAPNLPLDLKINYFQGPRQKIALQFFWRKKIEGRANSSLCGVSRPHPNTIAQEGWVIVPAEVFTLPGGDVNPCTDKEIIDRVSEIQFEESTQDIQELVKSIKLYTQDSESEEKIRYNGLFQVNIEDNDDENFQITIIPDEDLPIMRDVDKKIIIEYETAE